MKTDSIAAAQVCLVPEAGSAGVAGSPATTACVATCVPSAQVSRSRASTAACPVWRQDREHQILVQQPVGRAFTDAWILGPNEATASSPLGVRTRIPR